MHTYLTKRPSDGLNRSCMSTYCWSLQIVENQQNKKILKINAYSTSNTCTCSCSCKRLHSTWMLSGVSRFNFPLTHWARDLTLNLMNYTQIGAMCVRFTLFLRLPISFHLCACCPYLRKRYGIDNTLGNKHTENGIFSRKDNQSVFISNCRITKTKCDICIAVSFFYLSVLFVCEIRPDTRFEFWQNW